MRKVTLSALIVMSSTSQAIAYSKDKNWPCIQGKVEALSSGQMWRISPLDESDTSWKDNKDVKDLAEAILPRRTPLTETEKKITIFATRHPENLNLLLEQVFLALLSETNKIRHEIILGIGRFSQRQKDLATRITDNRHKLKTYEEKDKNNTLTKAEDKEMVQIEQAIEWDLRIHEERETSLQYVCEAPVLSEQRLFALTKQLQTHLKK